MAENLTAVMNILLIPFISLFILYHKNGKSLGTRFEIAMKYAILTVLVSIATECVSYALLTLFEREITAYSSYYTVIATAVALCLPFIVKGVKVKIIKAKHEREEKTCEKEKPKEE